MSLRALNKNHNTLFQLYQQQNRWLRLAKEIPPRTESPLLKSFRRDYIAKAWAARVEFNAVREESRTV